MGKYPNSAIHAAYSDWHYQTTELHREFKKLWCTDIDRLWVEVDQDTKGIVAVCDLKWLGSGDSVTPTEQIVYDWFRSKVSGFLSSKLTKSLSSLKSKFMGLIKSTGTAQKVMPDFYSILGSKLRRSS